MIKSFKYFKNNFHDFFIVLDNISYANLMNKEYAYKKDLHLNIYRLWLSDHTYINICNEAYIKDLGVLRKHIVSRK